MQNKLAGKLSQIISDAFDIGYKLSVNTTLTDKTLILSNKTSGKVALIGATPNGVEACMVDLRAWLWAEAEGFTKDEITTDKKLSDKVFKHVDVENLAVLLS